MAIPITVRCECGETHSAKLGETVVCGCGREFDTSTLDENRFVQVREHRARTALYVRLGLVWVVGIGFVTFFLWGKWGVAIGAPFAAIIWFRVIRRWFMRKFVPSPGDLTPLELEATNR